VHRRQIRAAIDAEPMSELAERAIVFPHPELVDEASILWSKSSSLIVQSVGFGAKRKWFPGESTRVIAQEQLPVEVRNETDKRKRTVSSLLVSKT